MNVDRLISAPGGDMPATPELLEKPYRISLSEQHPSLTLEDYFSAAEDFIAKDHGDSLAALLTTHAGRSVTAEDITRIRIRSEKHGALYHVSSVEVFWGAQSFTLALSAAVTEVGKRRLDGEWDTLTTLEKSFHLPYLPQPYFRGEAGGPGRDAFSMLAAQWFEGFSEWHLSVDGRSHAQRLVVWDGTRGNRWASERESREIYRNAAAILTRYYDPRTYQQIHPWRHAAGDFVVRDRNGRTEVRLTTARGYEPVITRLSGAVQPLIAMVYFFLDLVTQMRVDRLDGTGELAFADASALEAAAEGFLGALGEGEALGNYPPGAANDLVSLLKRFDWKEMESLFDPLLGFYEEEDPDALSLIRRSLDSHAREICRVIQSLP